jgi:CRISPR-associated endonuclease/helicase Cas3
VPTGGGKTLSSLSFALDHAVAHDLKRVIYAIPFTSIIEQNAGIFQDILGREAVLEHHSNYKEQDDPEEDAYEKKRGLLTENWDAPVVVTTNMQFFESFFSHKPSRCRKLHNIAGSVIVLDEAQAIPTGYLEPCLAVLRELVEHYRCTVLLCTATQPAFDDKGNLRTALPKITEIVENPQTLYHQLQRTQVHFTGVLSEVDLAERLSKERQVLCITATKPEARSVFEKLDQKERGTFHLSTNMYPEHRRRVLASIRNRLGQNQPCIVISTSLVEAGVDLDFPVVYRAMAGLDSIAQAAGRCNREGKLKKDGKPSMGRVFVYEPAKSPRMPWLRRCVTRAKEVLRKLSPDADSIGLAAMRSYFELLYDIQGTDNKLILKRFPTIQQMTQEFVFPFRDVGKEFRFIEDETVGVVIPVEPEAEKWIQQLRYAEFPRMILRKLQAHTVSVRHNDFVALKKAGALEIIRDKIPVLRNLKAYDKDVGLRVDHGDVWEIEDLIQ